MTDAADLTMSSFQSEVKAQIIEMEDRHSRMVQKKRPKEMQDILRVRIDIMRELLAYLGGETASAPEPEVSTDEDLDDSLD